MSAPKLLPGMMTARVFVEYAPSIQERIVAHLEARDALWGAEVERLAADAETERMRLAGCGVAAMQDTPTSIKDRITEGHPYWSASYGDVCRRVDDVISLRAEVALWMKATGRDDAEALDLELGRDGIDAHLRVINGMRIDAQRERDEAKAEVERLRAALRKIATCDNCAGSGTRSARVANAYNPDASDDVETECGECSGTGVTPGFEKEAKLAGGPQ